MTFAKANLAGWALYELLLSSQMNTIDTNLTYALDGRDGGAYAPSANMRLDGQNLTVDPVLELRDSTTLNSYALFIRVMNGGGRGLLIQADVDAQSTNLIRLDAGTGNTGNSAALVVTGKTNRLANGAFGGQLFGGATNNAGSTGGRALQGTGGDGTVANSTGGLGLQGLGGLSNFTGTTGSLRYGGAGLDGEGGNVVGAYSGHVGGMGGFLLGGTVTGTGRGGPGAYAQGGLGPSGSTSGTDAGIGAAARGFQGVFASTLGIDPSAPPAEFTLTTQRAALVAAGKTEGMGIVSEFSGSSSASSLNRFSWVGVGGSAFKTIVFASSLLASGTGLITGFGANDNSGLSTTRFLAADLAGVGAPAVRTSASYGATIQPPALQLFEQLKMNDQTYREGAIAFLQSGQVTGQTDSCLYMGSGVSRQCYDRVVGSGDRACAQAWARMNSDGSGGWTLGSNYGVSTVSIGSSGGNKYFIVTLDTIAGQPIVTAIVGLAAVPTFAGYSATVVPISATVVRVLVTNNLTGANVDLDVIAIEVHMVLFGATTFASSADRPTYYQP